MNYQRRKVRPRQPAIPSAPASGTMKSGSGMGMKGTVGNGKCCDDHKGSMGRKK